MQKWTPVTWNLRLVHNTFSYIFFKGMNFWWNSIKSPEEFIPSVTSLLPMCLGSVWLAHTFWCITLATVAWREVTVESTLYGSVHWLVNTTERNGPPCWIVVPWFRDTSGQRPKVEQLLVPHSSIVNQNSLPAILKCIIPLRLHVAKTKLWQPHHFL